MHGSVVDILLEATHEMAEGVSSLQQLVEQFTAHKEILNGLSSKSIRVRVREGGFPVAESGMIAVEDMGDEREGKQRLRFQNFPPGAVLIVRVQLGGKAKRAMRALHDLVQSEVS